MTQPANLAGMQKSMLTGFVDAESLPLPKDWSATVRNAVLNVIGIVRIAMLAGREALIQEGDVKDAVPTIFR